MNRLLKDLKSVGWRRCFLLLRVALTLIILAVVVLRVDVGRIGSAFQSVRASSSILALLLAPLNLSVQMYRWHFIVKTADSVAPPKDVLRSVLTGLGFSLATPGRIGEVGRALYVPSSNPVRIVGLVILEKVFAFIAILIASAVSIMLWGGLAAGALLIVCALLSAFRLSSIRALLSRLTFLLPFGQRVADLWSAWDRFGRKQIASLLAISMGFFAIVFLQFYALVSSFQAVKLLPALISIPLTMAVNCLPITVAGLGLREGAAVFFFSKFGVSEAAALNGAFLLFIIDILIPGLIGLPLISKMRLKFEHLDEERSHR
ncbi:MAG: lysylphosphatidylglycerol synthase transmembrane domain-containing protein [bacterium]